MTNPRLDAALHLAALGYRVVALHNPIDTGEKSTCSCSKPITCEHKGKHPRYDKTTLAHGANSATTNAEVIRSWWEMWPDANVGLVTGSASGVIAIDIDPRNGGTATWEALEAELGLFPHTVESETGGGGQHLLAVRPAGGHVRGTLGAGVDVQDEGKLIVVAPSQHPSGNYYTWKPGQAPGEVVVAELPDQWKRVLLEEDRDDRENRDNREDRDDRGMTGPPSPPTPVLPVLPVIPVIPVLPVLPVTPGNGTKTDF